MTGGRSHALRLFTAIAFAFPFPASCAEPAIAGAWIAGDAEAVVIERTAGGSHEIRVDGVVVARQREGRHDDRRPIAFDAMPDGGTFMRERAGRLAYLTHDDFLIWAVEARGFPYFSFDGRAGSRERVRAWRRAGSVWPSFHCAGERVDLVFAQGPDFLARVSGAASDASRLRCDLELESMRYCPDCRGLTDHLRFRVTDRCESDKAATPTPDGKPMPRPGHSITFDVAHGTYFTRIDRLGAGPDGEHDMLRCSRLW